MTSNSFTDNFWGEKNNGFDVLYHNMKHGYLSSKEFSDFLRESCSVEETYAKLLAKLAKMASNSNSHGSYAPFWRALKTLAEKLSTIHMQLVHSWQDLIKDLQRYMDEQHKKHKTMKDSESATLETVQCIQATTTAVHKAKETYHARCLEYERLKRESATQKELERAEAKYKKANDEYRSLVDKYANVRNDFEKRMVDSCQHFQETEEHHLQQMKDFVDTYAKAWENQHALIGQVHQEFLANSAYLSVERLLDNLVQQKTTGTEIPGPINFEDADLSSLPPPVQQNSQDKEVPILERPSKTADTSEAGPAVAAESVVPKLGLLDIKGFLSKSRREKKKEKKKKKKDKEKSENNESEEATPQVDDEGFSVRPENVNDRTSYDSSTDSESDSEVNKKFKVEIKPFSPNGSTPTGNVDDIRKSIEGLRLSPTSNRRAAISDSSMKRSVSVTDSMSSSNSNSGKPSQDLLGLDIFGGSSSASTPTGGSYGSFPLPTQRADVATVSTNTSALTTPVTNTNDYFIGSPADTPPGVPARHRAGTPTGAAMIPSIGPPPIRSSPRGNMSVPSYTYKATARPAGRMSPAPNKMDRADSVSNLNSVTFNTTSMPIGSSRGPSPLTIGMSDNIPLAIAFSETINGYFKGTADANCKVKLTGDMMVSFPAGIVKVLTDNPSPAMLSFRIKNTTNLEHILVNKQLVVQDTSLSTADSMVYTFDMGMLTEHLRRQADTNKLASYFNIDILKYQVKIKPGMQSTPLHLVAYWKCDQTQTDFRLDYQYNTKAIGLPTPLNNITVLVPVDGDVTHMQSKPTASWSSEHNRAIWKLNDISDMNEEGGQGCLRAKFDLADGPSTPSTVAVQFICEGTTLSGIDFELVGLGYRVSLVKKRFVTGKYIAEAESPIQYV